MRDSDEMQENKLFINKKADKAHPVSPRHNRFSPIFYAALKNVRDVFNPYKTADKPTRGKK